MLAFIITSKVIVVVREGTFLRSVTEQTEHFYFEQTETILIDHEL